MAAEIALVGVIQNIPIINNGFDAIIAKWMRLGASASLQLLCLITVKIIITNSVLGHMIRGSRGSLFIIYFHRLFALFYC